MSDPLSKHDIEDVLSSIRRLVSEELRPLQPNVTAPQDLGQDLDQDLGRDMSPLPLRSEGSGVLPVEQVAPIIASVSEVEAAEVGKLLLTPSLRVVADQGVSVAPNQAEAASLSNASDTTLLLTQPPLADQDAVETGDLSPAEAERVDAGQAEEIAAGAAFWQQRAAHPSEVPHHYDDVALDLGGSGLRAVMAAVGPADGLTTPDDLIWAAAGTEDVEDAAGAAGQNAAATPDPDGLQQPAHWSAEAVPDVSWIAAEQDGAEDDAQAFDARDQAPASFLARPRLPLAHVASPPAKPALAPLTLAKTDMVEADMVEAEVMTQLSERVVAMAEAGFGIAPAISAPHGREGDLAGADQAVALAPALVAEAPPAVADDLDADHLLEEEVLRDIVRGLIREELAGPLGERITRNMRKLVRAEVNRAMALRAFD